MSHGLASGCGASTPLMLAMGQCNSGGKVWHETLKLFAWHLKALEVMLINLISFPGTNLPFNPATNYPVSSKEQ